MFLQGQACNMHPYQRKECGWAGISKATCESRGCCFDDSIPDVKWCFYKQGTIGMKKPCEFVNLF